MIGDVLTSSVICENLKRSFPTAEVHYLINRFTYPVVKGHKYIDKFVFFEDEYSQSRLKFYRFLQSIAQQNYTHVFDAYSKLGSLLITKFTKANYRYSFKKFYTQFCYTQTIPITHKAKTEAGSAIENRLKLLQLENKAKIYTNKPQIYLTSAEVQNTSQKLSSFVSKDDNLIMVSALGSMISKTYPLKYLAELLNHLCQQINLKLVLNYMPEQHKEIEELVSYCEPQTQQQILWELTPSSLRDFMCVCSQCQVTIGNEGGAINIAKALNIPSFSIFSPWISKQGWNSFEVNYPNKSVHLSDYQPELFKNQKTKEIKDNYAEFYRLFKPSLFKKQLTCFVKQHVD